jgi:hypothetical protein
MIGSTLSADLPGPTKVPSRSSERQELHGRALRMATPRIAQRAVVLARLQQIEVGVAAAERYFAECV